ncbi:hypothetical protein BTO06_10875 [Tenacibaculum sp. SZ-18]|uniref:hypothetical protein n=1 Tax=Tenacibaculum sp. SZ-18 TaxID=754423 RepID=UPI000C2D66CF|nr:hypothetical protein [Tenacibaculum sp. SZ-18]AUC15618.1 hypothetical protein BTO06_10875 [Tenacibaculum sp. SZ-18]
MKTLINLTICFLTYFQVLGIQSQTFNTKLEELSNSLEKVITSKSTFDLSITSDLPGVANFTQTETTTKGKVTEITYEFNFADIDINTVRYETSKDLIKVQLIAKQNQKMIKSIINSDKVSYTKAFYILASNVDNARKIVDDIKNLIPVAKKITENRLSLNGYEDRLAWLTKNIFTVESGKSKVEQGLEVLDSYPASVRFINAKSTSKSVLKTSYEFNLSNMNERGVLFKNKGSDFVVIIPAKRNLKAIKVINNGVVKSYVSKFEIICKSVENARELQKVLQDIIPLAEKRFKAVLPGQLTTNTGIDLINNKIEKLVSSKETIIQKLEGDCIVKIFREIETSKKKDSHSYELNLIDINKEDVEISIKGKKVHLSINTIGKNKFIKHTKNDIQQKYVSKIDLICNGIEDATVCREAIRILVGNCTQRKLETPQTLTALSGELKKVSLGKLTQDQRLESSEDGGIKFTAIQSSTKESVENIQEFKLEDLNPKSIAMKVTGKKVIVEITTNYQEKIIKTYKDGEIKNYTNKVQLYCDSIENGRNISNILRKITGKN